MMFYYMLSVSKDFGVFLSVPTPSDNQMAIALSMIFNGSSQFSYIFTLFIYSFSEETYDACFPLTFLPAHKQHFLFSNIF